MLNTAPFDAGLAARLETFLNAARPLQVAIAAGHTTRNVNTLDVLRLRGTLDAISPLLNKIRATGVGFNPWVAAGLKHNEVRNSAALASLWRTGTCGETARAFLLAFLERVRYPDDHLAFITNQILAGCTYSVACEQCPMGEVTDRIDLLIEGEGFLLGIEVKIHAGLGERQLERYVSSLQRRAELSKQRLSLIFLAPNDLRAGISAGYASWNDIAGAARKVAKATRSAAPNRGGALPPMAAYLEHFAQHVSNF